MATAVGHAPQVALIDAGAGSRMAIAEALTNLLSLLPSRVACVSHSLVQTGCGLVATRARTHVSMRAVQACSGAIDLGINIPTARTSLSMTRSIPTESK